MVGELLRNYQHLGIACVKPSIHLFGPGEFEVYLAFCTEEEVPVVYEKIGIKATENTHDNQKVAMAASLDCSPSIHILLQARHMLESCRSKHPKCAEDADAGWLPTRLIFVGSSEHPVDARLTITSDLEPSERPTHYVALSHKWGKIPFLMLEEKKNLAEFRARIPVEDLRTTFQDAIEVTRGLGFQYLWIDSLCIMQDSKEDWLRESVVMDLVYRNAVCTLAASEAESLEQGLFDAARPTIQLSFIHSLELLGSPRCFTISLDPQSFIPRRLAQSPLLTRGWVVQERYLAPRTIYFGSPLIFECRECLMSDGYPGEVPIQYPLVIQRKIWPSLLQGEERPYKYWTTAVGAFTKCSLTKSEDRLIAMSGIAKTLAPILRSRYVAGLWEEYLPQCLLWCVDKVPAEDESAENVDSCGQEYIAPSWSWGSTKGAVSHLIPSSIDHLPLFQCTRISTQSRGEDPFGQIKHASMDIQAKILPLGTLKSVKDQLTSTTTTEIDPKWFRLDAPLRAETPIYLFPVLYCAQGNYCLLLVTAGQQDGGIPAYRRAGFARVDYRGCLAKSDWVVPGWTHDQPWPVEELGLARLL
ncbi:heterokaryon incompatibility protein-domain-containing protein [Aspergillus carlsbadensis]|nr:heterokaryon incompatibility protein-domain-containing protein [Aspergillus carlsbadensis]